MRCRGFSQSQASWSHNRNVSWHLVSYSQLAKTSCTNFMQTPLGFWLGIQKDVLVFSCGHEQGGNAHCLVQYCNVALQHVWAAACAPVKLTYVWQQIGFRWKSIPAATGKNFCFANAFFQCSYKICPVLKENTVVPDYLWPAWIKCTLLLKAKLFLCAPYNTMYCK